MPISDAGGAAALAAMFGLSGCGGDAALLVARSFTPLDGPAVEALAVQGDAVTIAGPPGYCIDASATRDRPDGVFVMLGDCARLYRDVTDSPEVSAVLTALVSPPSDLPQRPSPAQLERFFRSDDGRRVLSFAQDEATVTVEQTRIAGDTLLFLLRDTSDARPDGLSELSWRAVLTLRDRLVSLAVTGHVEEPLADGEARALLDDFLSAMRAANENGATPGE